MMLMARAHIHTYRTRGYHPTEHALISSTFRISLPLNLIIFVVYIKTILTTSYTSNNIKSSILSSLNKKQKKKIGAKLQWADGLRIADETMSLINSP